ncbi:lipocalin family protein [Chitinophaga sp. GCM10012297]|uniref:Lipocalin family protein n=1 Tax=Chitinophaga chungangae TaxID=2821488 RepID=A0ABS3YE37_9BACT|nr:lipocalin family protein [Chitinophaga chungangae]MBO9152951.1 lipocalin family protein [Chitinophaga chungangae]
MNKPWMLLTCLMAMAACQQPEKQAAVQDSAAAMPADSVADTLVMEADSVKVAPDTVHIDSTLAPGRWMQPVPGLDSLTQGIYLRKNGKASSINMHTLLYDKWALVKDTLFLWSHSEGVENPVTAVDTLLVKSLDDTSMVLFPLKAAPGYLEKYTRKGKGK